MSDTKTYTEREVIERERAAFVAGVDESFRAFRIRPYDSPGWRGSHQLAAERYPLPKVTRPRVVRREVGGFQFDWRFVDNTLQHANPGMEDWEDYCGVIHESGEWPALIAVLDDLRANPTEEVDA